MPSRVSEVVHQDVVQELMDRIKIEGWRQKFESAVYEAKSTGVCEMDSIQDFDDFVHFIDALLVQIPSESSHGSDQTHHKLATYYFVFRQLALIELHSPKNTETSARGPTWLSNWHVKYIETLGRFLGSTKSVTKNMLWSFRHDARYNMREYFEPRNGFESYNDFLARRLKDGYRTIASPIDDTVIVSPSDMTYAGQWGICGNEGVNIRSVPWKVSELLQGSRYENSFRGGIFMHAMLKPTDCRRLHAPIAGNVLESKVQTTEMCFEYGIKGEDDGKSVSICWERKWEGSKLKSNPAVWIRDKAEYKFTYTRGITVLETSLGLVAVLQVGTNQLSSVVLTAEVGRTLEKGEEISYFQGGESDYVLLFEETSKITIKAQTDREYRMGSQIAKAYPAA